MFEMLHQISWTSCSGRKFDAFHNQLKGFQQISTNFSCERSSKSKCQLQPLVRWFTGTPPTHLCNDHIQLAVGGRNITGALHHIQNTLVPTSHRSHRLTQSRQTNWGSFPDLLLHHFWYILSPKPKQRLLLHRDRAKLANQKLGTENLKLFSG